MHPAHYKMDYSTLYLFTISNFSFTFAKKEKTILVETLSDLDHRTYTILSLFFLFFKKKKKKKKKSILLRDNEDSLRGRVHGWPLGLISMRVHSPEHCFWGSYGPITSDQVH
jgi:hypothetical protein